MQRNAVQDLPAGASAVPLSLSAGLPNHTLSFRCVPPPAYAAAAAADALPLWSRPVSVRVGVERQMYVVVPVIPPEEAAPAGDQAEGTAGADRDSSGRDAAHIAAQSGSRSSGDAAHLAPGHGSGGSGAAGWPPAVAILRLSVHRRGLGAMHVVLESMHSDPPYLLENRSQFPLQYRQVRPCGAWVLSPAPSLLRRLAELPGLWLPWPNGRLLNPGQLCLHAEAALAALLCTCRHMCGARRSMCWSP